MLGEIISHAVIKKNEKEHSFTKESHYGRNIPLFLACALQWNTERLQHKTITSPCRRARYIVSSQQFRNTTREGVFQEMAYLVLDSRLQAQLRLLAQPWEYCRTHNLFSTSSDRVSRKLKFLWQREQQVENELWIIWWIFSFVLQMCESCKHIRKPEGVRMIREIEWGTTEIELQSAFSICFLSRTLWIFNSKCQWNEAISGEEDGKSLENCLISSWESSSLKVQQKVLPWRQFMTRDERSW